MEVKYFDILNLTEKYHCHVISFQEWLNSLGKKYNQQKKSAICIPDGLIIPDEVYVKKLIKNLNILEMGLSLLEVQSIKIETIKKKLESILDESDFDDAEEIMGSVHEIVKNQLYSYDTKVSMQGWNVIVEYIKRAGYKSDDVRAGDSIDGNIRHHFDQAIPVKGGKTKTIKNVQRQPFVVRFYDRGEVGENNRVKTMILYGKCTYYTGDKE